MTLQTEIANQRVIRFVFNQLAVAPCGFLARII